MTDLTVPTLGESISSGILATWHVQDGALVREGQALYELETDKITSEGTAPVSGKISLKAKEGEEVAIGALIAQIDESVPVPDAEAAPKETPTAAKPELQPKPASNPTPAPATPSELPHSPAVRRMIAEEGIAPADIPGTGKGGRLTKGDLIAAREQTPPAPQPASPKKTAETTSSSQRTSRKKLSPLRRRIAERLVAAQHTAAMLTTFNECDMSAVIDLRKRYQDDFVKRHGVKLGFMSFFVKAVVHALQEVPGLNAQIEGDELVQNHFYDIGVAVGTPKGLLVPVLRDCERKGFAQVEQDILAYAQKARDGKIAIEDLQGGSFTISNGGIYGSMLSTPILNTPQSGILGMHAIKERPVALNGQVVIRPMMYLALSYDHRIVDGQQAVTFLVKVKDAIEAPERLLFEC